MIYLLSGIVPITVYLYIWLYIIMYCIYDVGIIDLRY